MVIDCFVEDLNFFNNGYLIMLCVYFICLCVFGVFGLWFICKIGFCYIIFGIMLGWGMMVMVNVVVNNYVGCFVVCGCELVFLRY